MPDPCLVEKQGMAIGRDGCSEKRTEIPNCRCPYEWAFREGCQDEMGRERPFLIDRPYETIRRMQILN